MKLKQLWRGMAAVCLAGFTLSAQAVCVPGLDSAATFIDNCGRADKHLAEVKRAQAVFDKVRRVANQRHEYEARLVVTAKPDALMAVAVPDAIVLSLETLRFCYRDVTEEDGDTRLAFVLGHELAHQSNKDMRNRRTRAWDQAEPNADEDGFLYAAMAGYPVDRLLIPGTTFFSAWGQAQNGETTDSAHGTADERAAGLQVKLAYLLERIVYFQFGTRLAHFGRYQDAKYFLQSFREYFAAPETLNNLGYIHLQLALQEMGQHSGAYDAEQTDNLPYCLPALLDLHSRAELLGPPVRQVLRSVDETAAEYLRQAQTYFKEATELEPGYGPAWLNGAVTTFYLEDYSQARWLTDEAEKHLSGNTSVQTLRALITLAQGGTVDTWPNALVHLQSLADRKNAAACDIYNTALLLDQRGRTEAQVYWHRLTQQAADLPELLRMIVCAQKKCPVAIPDSKMKLPWRLPVEVGESLTPLPRQLREWKSYPFDFMRKVRGTIYQAPDGSAEILGFSGENGTHADMLVLKSGFPSAPDKIAPYCQKPLQQQQSNSTIGSCKTWAVLIEEGKAKEIWIAE